MKLLQNMFDSLRPMFEGDGKFKAAKPLFDAMDNFFFAASTRTGTSPHIRDPLDVKRFMSMVIIALLPCLAMSLYYFGWRIVPVIIVSYMVGGTIEVLFAIVRKEEINEGFLVTGLLFPLIMPPAVPLWIVAAGIAFGVLIGKELFGGTGRNLFNPALLGRCFVFLAYPKALSSGWVLPQAQWPGRLAQYITPEGTNLFTGQVADAISGATPLAQAKQGNWAAISDLIVGNTAGCIGETCAIAIIIGAIILIVCKVSNWRTTVSTLGSFLVLGGIMHHFQPNTFGPVTWHLWAGGLLFGAVFMTTDPVTSPNTNQGKWIYGMIIGVSTVLIRNLTGYVEGVTFAILLGNISAPILDEIAIRQHQRRLLNEG